MSKQKLELSIHPEYVEWGTWESLREIVQNALDEDALGNKVSFRHRGDTLTISNKGSRLKRQNLLLGGSEKRGREDQRGQFGEGMKLSWASLVRMGKTVSIRSGDEKWEPRVERSSAFDSDVLTVEISKGKEEDGVTTKISGISKAEWNETKSKILHFSESKRVETSYGAVLTDKAQKGRIYSKGIFVCKDERFSYGFDLLDIKIDRDRRLVDPSSLRWEVLYALRSAVASGGLDPKGLLEAASGEGGEADAMDLEKWVSGSGEFNRKITAAFKEKHGDNAIPVLSIEDSIKAKNNGFKGVLVSTGIAAAVSKETGTIDQVVSKKHTDVVKHYGVDDMTEEQLENLQLSMLLIEKTEIGKQIEASLGRVKVVDFHGEDTLGRHLGDGSVAIACKVLDDRAETVATLVHEFCHDFGGDETREHVRAMEKMFSQIIASQIQ